MRAPRRTNLAVLRHASSATSAFHLSRRLRPVRMAYCRVHAPLRACAFAWCALSWSSRALASPELGANKDYEPLGADEYVEEQGRRDVDAFGATTLAPAVSSDAAAASPAPYASPSLADTDLASRSLVETYPPEVMLSVDDPRTPPAIGSWAAPPTSTHLRRGKPPSRANIRRPPRRQRVRLRRQGTRRGVQRRLHSPRRRRAVADFDPRFHEAACGSCYEVRCVTGPIIWDYDQTKVRYPREPPGFFEVDPDARDSEGRKTPARNAAKFPGSNDEFEYARCWNDTASIFVTIVDVCPCSYSWGKQRVCCGPIPHFDLSFWAAERLAHPVRWKTDASLSAGGLRDARTGERAARRGRAHAHASTRVARRCVNERRRKRPTRRLVPRRSSGRRRRRGGRVPAQADDLLRDGAGARTRT